MKFSLGPEVVLSYKRLSYTPWYALAEFVDNSTQAYTNSKQILDEAYNTEKNRLTVKINISLELIEVTDNSIGMSEEQLQAAITVGKAPDNTAGRSKYGLGLKTAAFWFGNKVTIITKKLNEPNEITIELDVDKIAADELDIVPTIRQLDLKEHYTKIEIRDLNRRVVARSKTKVKDYLRSFYRVDISQGKLKLLFDNVPLKWDYQDELFSKLIVLANGEPAKMAINIEVDNKRITGWAGVLRKGSRSLGGFSLLQSNRVVKGWPLAFKPSLIFGQQEGGTNNLVNQRLTGELNVDGFEVSHTKDEILFSDEQLEELDKKLAELLKDFVYLATNYRKNLIDSSGGDRDKFSEGAMLVLDTELNSDEFVDAYNYEIIMPEDVLREAKIIYLSKVKESFKPKREFEIAGIKVVLYIVDDQSIYDPYLTIQPAGEKALFIVVSRSHPHWNQLENENAVLNFLRHCIYDGLAEWKTSRLLGLIDPDTVKLYKDQFLRIPFSMEKHGRDTIDKNVDEELFSRD